MPFSAGKVKTEVQKETYELFTIPFKGLGSVRFFVFKKM